MAEILLVSLLALAAAVYQILQPSDKLRIKYAFSARRKNVVFSSVIFIVVLYLLGRFLATVNLSFRLFCGFWCLPALFWIDIFQIASVGVIFYIGKSTLINDTPSVAEDEHLSEVLRTLETEKKYITLLNVINDNFAYLFTNGGGNRGSDTVIERTLSSEEVASKLAMTKPDLGLKIISTDSDWFPRQEFTDQFLRGLHKESSSILYREIQNNRNGEYNNYSIESGNELLDTLFNDDSLACELLVWKPIGDRTIEFIEEQGDERYDTYNRRNKRFSIFNERVIFRDPIFISIRYFNIILIQGLRNNVDDHMWVSYLEGFVKKICENHGNLSEVESQDEFDTDYTYLLDDIFSTLESIIETVTNQSSPTYCSIQRPDITVEDDIIKMSIWTLVQSYYHVINTESINSETQRMLSNKVFNCYLKLAGIYIDESDMYYRSMRSFFLEDDPMNPVSGREFSKFQREVYSDLRSYDIVSIHSDIKSDAYRDLESSLGTALNETV